MSKPNVIFAARAEGMGKNAVIISIHKNYSDYAKSLTDVLLEGGDYIQDYESLLISLRGTIVKPFSLKYLADLEET